MEMWKGVGDGLWQDDVTGPQLALSFWVERAPFSRGGQGSSSLGLDTAPPALTSAGGQRPWSSRGSESALLFTEHLLCARQVVNSPVSVFTPCL